MFQNYKFNFATENSEQLLSVFVTGSVVMTVILNTTFVLWLTAQSVHCTLLQPGCTKIFNGLDLIQFSVANGTAGDQLHLPFGSAVTTAVDTAAEQQVGTVTGGETDTELFLETLHTVGDRKLTWADCC